MVRLWRELVSGTTAMQGPFTIAVCDTDPGGAYNAAAHEHFGALLPMHIHRTPAQAIREVSAGLAAAAVLPMPAEGELPGAAWWTALLHKDDPRIHVTARLPFWAPRPDGAPRVQALVVGAVAPDPSGSDRSLLGLEVAMDVSRDRLALALTAAGFEPGTTILRRDPAAGVAHALVDIAGFVTEDDPRLTALKNAVLRLFSASPRMSAACPSLPALTGSSSSAATRVHSGRRPAPPPQRQRPRPRCTTIRMATQRRCGRPLGPNSVWTQRASSAARARTSCCSC
jgi:hypothetical protein